MRATQRLQELVTPVNEVITVEEHDSDDSEDTDFYDKLLAEKDTSRLEGTVMATRYLCEKTRIWLIFVWFNNWISAAATTGITEELLQWEQMARVKDRSTDVFKFWRDRPVMPVLKEVAMAALSFPVTQVSVESLFSELKFILNDQRASLSDQSVPEIMFVRMNKQFS